MTNNNRTAYTRREIDLFIANLSQKFDLWDIKLDSIEEQVKNINGRVTHNTEDIVGLRSWRDRFIGGGLIITILVIPMIAYIVKLWFG